MTKSDVIELLMYNPLLVAKSVGFKRLTDLHNMWIKEMINIDGEDKTLQAHRGSYKTTCVSVALAILILLYPFKKILFLRKTDDDVKEVIKQTKNILLSKQFQTIAYILYGKPIILTTDNQNQIDTNLNNDIKGGVQLIGLGIGASLTGKHYDLIFTDDIVNIKDRISGAERKRTRTIYQELQNVKNVGGRIYNTGTPWHKEDCFELMPPAEQFDCYVTGILTIEEIEIIKGNMTASLFCANYELRHIASENVVFENAVTFYDEISKCYDGIAHIDAGYGGGDSSALTIINKKYFAFGKRYDGHIDDVLDRWLDVIDECRAGIIYCEDNADKGYLAKEIKEKIKARAIKHKVISYHENENKYIKITTYGKKIWNDTQFYKETDKGYLQQIQDYNEYAEHDDCPDSYSCCGRLLLKPKRDSLL